MYSSETLDSVDWSRFSGGGGSGCSGVSILISTGSLTISIMLIRELSDGFRQGSSLSEFGLLKMSIFSAWTLMDMFVSSSSVISSSMIDCSRNCGFGVSTTGGDTARTVVFFGFSFGEKSFSIFDIFDGESLVTLSGLAVVAACCFSSLLVLLAIKDLATSIFFRGNLGDIFESFEPILVLNFDFLSGDSVRFGVVGGDDGFVAGGGGDGVGMEGTSIVSTVFGVSGKLFAEDGLFSSSGFGSIELELVRCGGVGGFVSSFSS